MGFEPQNFDGQAAAQRMIARGTAPHLSCLETVAYAIKGDVNSDNPGYYDMAIDGYAATPDDRFHVYQAGYEALAGTVGYATTSNRPDGHVWINLGSNRVVSTDTPSNGRIGVTTVQELVSRMGIGPLGWTDWFLGHNLVNLGSSSPAGGNVRPLNRRKRTMYIVDNLKNDINDPAWPVGMYLVTDTGVSIPKNGLVFSAVARLNGLPVTDRGTPLYSSELKALNEDLTAPKGGKK